MIIFTARDSVTGQLITATAVTERDAGEGLIHNLLAFVAERPDATGLDHWEINMGESAR